MITIANRLRPFSHTPGTQCLIPGTTKVLTAYPTRIEIDGEAQELEVTGPVEKFLVQQDLEKGCVTVEGHAASGFFRHVIQGEPIPHLERLSLGCHKKQDWDLVTRRCDLIEIAPFWFQLAQWTPGSADKALEMDLKQAFQAGFTGILVPQANDPLHQGLPRPPSDLLHAGAQAIRDAILQADATSLTIPRPTWTVGRLVGAQAPFGTIDLEWTKGAPRQMVIHPSPDTQITLHLPPEIKQCRLNRTTVLKNGALLNLQAGEVVALDRFEK